VNMRKRIQRKGVSVWMPGRVVRSLDGRAWRMHWTTMYPENRA